MSQWHRSVALCGRCLAILGRFAILGCFAVLGQGIKGHGPRCGWTLQCTGSCRSLGALGHFPGSGELKGFSIWDARAVGGAVGGSWV